MSAAAKVQRAHAALAETIGFEEAFKEPKTDLLVDAARAYGGRVDALIVALAEHAQQVSGRSRVLELVAAGLSYAMLQKPQYWLAVTQTRLDDSLMWISIASDKRRDRGARERAIALLRVRGQGSGRLGHFTDHRFSPILPTQHTHHLQREPHGRGGARGVAMRAWMVDPEVLCQQHLLGEHVEMHMFVGSLRKGLSLQGYLDMGLVEPRRIAERHERLVAEMARRGMNHASPLPEYTYDGPDGVVDVEHSYLELARRCADCRERQEKKKAMRKSWSPTSLVEYEECPMRWARWSIYGDTVPEDLMRNDEEEIRLRMGSAWHTLIDQWLDDGKFDREFLVSKWAETAKKHLGFYATRTLAVQLLKGAYPNIVNFHKRIHALGMNRRPLLVEKRLKMPLSAGWELSGRLDAAWQHGLPVPDQGGGILEIVDWKSGMGVKSEETVRADLQLMTYSLLVMREFGVNRVQATLHYVTRDVRVSVMHERRDIEMKVLRRYETAAAQIDRRSFPQVNDSRCNDCIFTKAGRPCAGSPPALAAKAAEAV